MNLIDLIAAGEDSKRQFKLRFNSTDALSSEIAAMANSEGGEIIVGVSDDGKPVGVKNLSKLNQMISNACSQKIEPPISVTTENVLFDNKLVLIIRVPLGINKPYAVNKRDFWIKVGADKRRASREELRRLMQASGGLYADEMPVEGAGIEEIDLYAFRQFYEKNYGMPMESTGLSEKRILQNLKLASGGKLSLAGLLLFGKNPERIKPQYVVKAVAFAGIDAGSTTYYDSEDIAGILPAVFKDSMAFVKRNLHKIQNGQNVNYPGVLEIPEIAIEEAVVNALIHRDYFINSGVRLFVFDDRVEVISPGKLPNTVTTENILHRIQIVRNPILLSFVNKLQIPYRGIGSGIIRMIQECKQANLPPPEFVEDKDAELFKVIFQRRKRRSLATH